MVKSIGSLNRGSALGKMAATSFVGRRRELIEAKARMAESHLVTLTGPGGVGKTRLAVELADRSKKAFKDGVWLIELDSLRAVDRLASVVATTLSVPDQSNRAALDRVVDYLRDKEVLLVLDNCEHVLSGAAELADTLLSTALKVRILATSREPLHIVAEHIFAVPTLSAPLLGEDVEMDTVEQFESMALLVDRARNLVPDFAVTSENRNDIAQLCASLDGIPLAIELASTKLRALSPAQLLDRLDQRFQLLNRGDRAMLPRHQTLQALVDWSFELCSHSEQLLWRRLSIFPDVFDLDAAESVCGFGDLDALEVFDLLEQLVAKSILQTDRSTEPVRFRQLMTVREYGAQLLTDAAEEHELRRRHCDHYLHLAETRTAAWYSPNQVATIATTRAERPNLTAALEWSLDAEVQYDSAARIAVALRYYWIAGGFLSDGRVWLERILQEPELSPHDRGSVSWVAAWVALIQGDHSDASEHLELSLALAQTLRDPEMETFARHWQALHHLFTGNLTMAIALYREVVFEHEHHGRPADRLTAIYQMVMALAFNNQAEEGLRTSLAALMIAEGQGEQWNCAYLWWISGVCHWQLGDYPAAVKAATNALNIQQDFQDAICTALSIELLSWTAVSTGDFERGRETAETAEAVWRGLGTGIGAFGPHIAATALASSEKFRKKLVAKEPDGGPRRRLSPEEAVAATLGINLGTIAEEASAVANPLTRRESQIAELVSQGLTNRQVADNLVLSPRTVDGHVERIFTKLNLSSRMQLASWVESTRRLLPEGGGPTPTSRDSNCRHRNCVDSA